MDFVSFIIIIICQTSICLFLLNLLIEVKTIRQDKLTRMEGIYVRVKEKYTRWRR